SRGSARHHVWQLVGPNGEHAQLRHHPRFVTDDMHALRDAAIHGVGIVQLPCMVVEDDLRDEQGGRAAHAHDAARLRVPALDHLARGVGFDQHGETALVEFAPGFRDR
ncbi:LysR substrate-binding domain-containing protein, partial [Burkholderia cenocepacia]|nr:LysR substrate-binding domain-containing protein [Burkholderia cenocepacia]